MASKKQPMERTFKASDVNGILEKNALMSRANGCDVKTIAFIQCQLFGDISARIRNLLGLPTQYEISELLKTEWSEERVVDGLRYKLGKREV